MTIATKKITLPYKFKPRWYQLELLKALDSGIKRAVCVHHRGAGKDLMCLNYLIKKAMEKPGVYLHCFPNYNQGKRAIWKSVHDTHTGEAMAYLDHIPPEIIKRKNSSEMMIELINGSIYCVMGLDGKNAARARGMNPNFVILSEYAYMDPESWHTIEPRVSQNKGTAIFISTPNGQNHFYQLYNHACKNPNYFASLKTIEDTKTITLDHIDHLREEGVPEDFIQQEYFCNFSRGAEGSYYGKYIQRARDEDRICKLEIIDDLPVHTAWDLGMGDATAIWSFQALPSGSFHFIDYYENNGESLEHYAKYLKKQQQEKDFIFGTHFLPHDAANRELIAGIDRIMALRDLGINATVVKKASVDEGIQALRSLLNRCYFDATNCEQGIKCLDFYCKKYNEAMKIYYDTPLHNRWSHGADAARYFAIGAKTVGFDMSVTIGNEIDVASRFLGI